MNPILSHDARVHLHDFGEPVAFRDDSVDAIIELGADGGALLAVVDTDPGALTEGDGKRSWSDEIEVMLDRSDLPSVEMIEARKDAVRVRGVWRPVARVLEPDDPGTWRLRVGR